MSVSRILKWEELIAGTPKLNFRIANEANFQLNDKRILNSDDRVTTLLGANSFVSDPTSPELTDFELPLAPGVGFDMTVLAGPPGSAYLLLNQLLHTYDMVYNNYAINTDIQMIKADVYLDSDASLFTTLYSSLGNHTLSGQADHRSHHFAPFYVTQAYRVVFTCYASALVPGNVAVSFQQLVVKATKRLA